MRRQAHVPVDVFGRDYVLARDRAVAPRVGDHRVRVLAVEPIRDHLRVHALDELRPPHCEQDCANVPDRADARVLGPVRQYALDVDVDRAHEDDLVPVPTAVLNQPLSGLSP